MKKLYFLSVALFLFNAVVFSQTILFEENFDSYVAGQYLAAHSDDWTTWSETSGGSDDGAVTTDHALSPPNSVIIQGTTDLVLPLGDKTQGKFEIKLNLFIEAGCGGYYNFLHKFDGSDSEWAVEIFFCEDDTGWIRSAGENDPAATFTYTKDAWIECILTVDLDGDSAQLSIDGNWVHTWKWSLKTDGEQGLKQLGALDLYAATCSGVPKYYVDDISYTDITSSAVNENSTTFPTTTKLMNNYPNPFNPTTTITFTLKKASEVTLDVYNMNGQKVITLIKCFLLEGEHSAIWNGNDDSCRPVPSGFYVCKLKSGEFTSTQKMILMK